MRRQPSASVAARQSPARRGAAARLVVFRSNRGIFAQLVDDETARTLASASWKVVEQASGSKTEQATAVGKALADGCEVGRDRARACSTAAAICSTDASRRSPRARAREDSSFEHDPSERVPRAQGAGHRDQPSRQGRQGRQAVLVHRARRHRRRGGSRRPRLRKGARGPARDLEGRRGREEEPLHRAEARPDDHARDRGPVRRCARRSAPGERGHRRDRRAAAFAPCSSSPGSATCSPRASARRLRST